MRSVALGERTGLRVSAVALGTGRLGSRREGDIDFEEGAATIGAFIDGGGSFLDTSSAYLGGRAEAMIGQLLSSRLRDDIVIASKFGRTPSADPPPGRVGLHRKAMQAEVEGSLKRLRTDRIDLYFPHFDDGVTPIEEVLRGLDDLTAAGKILYVGLSNFPAWRVAAAVATSELLGLASLTTLQLQYSLLERSADREYLPLARAKGLALMAWSPTAGGRLVKPGTHEEGDPAAKLARAVADIAAHSGHDPVTVAIGWVASKGFVPIIGPRDRTQLAANLAAADLTLTPEQTRALDEASVPVLGYPYDLLAAQRAKLGLADPRAGAIW